MENENNRKLYDFMICLGYENPAVEIYELIEILSNKEKFYDFFVSVREACYKIENLKILSDGFEAIKNMELFTKKDCISGFIFLETIVDKEYSEFVLSCYSVSKESEKEYEKRVIDNFDELFPNYNFIKNQVFVKNLGVLDILAEEKETKRPVIIELKINSNNPKRQLLAYATDFDNPILISLTKKECLNKHKKIIYKVWE